MNYLDKTFEVTANKMDKKLYDITKAIEFLLGD